MTFIYFAGKARYDALVQPGRGVERPSEALRADYQRVESFSSGFSRSTGLALGDDGTIYVTGDEALARFPSDNATRTLIALEENPTAVAIKKDGTIFLAMRDHVELYSAHGKKLRSWPSFGKRSVLTGLAIDGDEVWVADAGNRLVWHCDANGTVLGALGRDKDMKASQLIIPSHHLEVQISPDGLPTITNPGKRQIERRARDGAVLSSWGESSNSLKGFSGCCNPTDFAFLPNGDIVTSEKGILRVKVYTASGDYRALVAQDSHFRAATVSLDIAVDKNGQVYVLERESNQVHRYMLNEEVQGQ